jgi:hypothetical protein
VLAAFHEMPRYYVLARTAPTIKLGHKSASHGARPPELWAMAMENLAVDGADAAVDARQWGIGSES